jgi:two-component system, chemotaxis family, sensor kinase CheA
MAGRKVMSARMKFRTLLYSGFGFLIAGMILILYLVINALNNQNQEMNMLVKDRYEKIKLANHIRADVGRISVEMNLYNQKKTITIDALQKVEHSTQTIEGDLRKLKEIIRLKEAKVILAQLSDHYQEFNILVNQMIALEAANEIDRMPEMFVEGELIREELIHQIDQLILFQEEMMEKTITDGEKTYLNALQNVTLTTIIGVLMAILLALFVVHSTTRRLNEVKNVMKAIIYGSETYPRISVKHNDEVGAIGEAYNELAAALEKYEKAERDNRVRMEEQNWLKTKVAETATMSQGLLEMEGFGRQFIRTISPMVSASFGVLYLKESVDEEEFLTRWASYASLSEEPIGKVHIQLGEGLVGQSALDCVPMLVEETPDDYLKISSGLGETKPASLMIVPVAFDGEVLAVMELASLQPFLPVHQELLKQIASQLGITINRIHKHRQVQELLEEAQTMNEELQTQSEELQMQQEELRTMNDELEAQYRNSEQRTKEVELIKNELEDKNREVLLGSQYKSEFLANMSHELRTPLNSLLILAQMLFENKNGNLDQKQLEYAHTIYSSGNDLLQLINDILDLSKVEAGKMDILHGDVVVSDITSLVEREFLPIAKRKGLHFSIIQSENVPARITTDEQRLYQILRNLLSNAFKFTEAGEIQFQIGEFSNMGSGLEYTTFSVKDTGIGIPKEKHSIIFEAFRQADGTTSRKFGGTGLGLSISKELAHKLNGYIEIESAEGEGSIFTLYLPKIVGKDSYLLETAADYEDSNEFAIELEPVLQTQVGNRLETQSGCFAGKRILMVDDDMRNIFALTSALEAEDMNVIFAENGIEALQILEGGAEVDLIIMDIMMPEMDGYETMKHIRLMPEFQELPIIALTAKAMKNDRQKCIDAGASDYISKPVNLEQLFSLLQVWLHK